MCVHQNLNVTIVMVYQDFTWKEFGKQNVTMHFHFNQFGGNRINQAYGMQITRAGKYLSLY